MVAAAEPDERKRQLDQAGHLADRDGCAATLEDGEVRGGGGIAERATGRPGIILAGGVEPVNVGDVEDRAAHRPRRDRNSSSGVIAKGLRRPSG